MMMDDFSNETATPGRAMLIGAKSFVTCRIVRGHFPEHSHQSIQISVPLRSSHTRASWMDQSDRRSAQLTHEDCICITPSFQPHAFEWGADTPFVGFYLNPQFLLQVLGSQRDPDRLDIQPKYGLRDPFIRQLALTVQAAFWKNHSPNHLLIESAATVVAARIAERHLSISSNVPRYRGGLSPQKLTLIREFIEAHLGQRLTLMNLAAMAGLSPYHFSRAFKQSTGRTLPQYLRERRVERAKQLLHDEELSLAHIALAVGFSSQSHLTTAFRQTSGHTPHAYRICIRR